MAQKHLNHVDELNEIEQKFKNIYLEHPNLHFETLHTSEELEAKSRLIGIDLMSITGIPLHQDMIESVFFEQEYDVAVFRHIRYLPPITHAHKFFEMICVLSGTCTNSIAGTSFQMNPGDICIIAPNTSHSLQAFSDDCIIYNFLIRASTFDTTFLEILSDKDILAEFFTKALYNNQNSTYLLFKTGNDKDLEDFIFHIYSENARDLKYKNRMLNSLISAFFIILLRNHEKDVIVPNPAGEEYDANIIFILNYMQSNFRTLSLAELARFFNYSERHLSRLIKDYTGSSFTSIIRELKVHKAAEMLKNPNTPLSEIIEASGYSDLSNFYRSFKKYYDVTPVEYRQKYV